MDERPGTPTVSVVIPTFNRSSLLPDALESVFIQGIADVQVIVVDDGSTDDTASVVSGYGRRVSYVYQPNWGPAAARNRGVGLASGLFVSFLDSDDVWLPGKLGVELDLFRRHPEADAIVSDCHRWDEGRRVGDSWLKDRGIGVGGDQPAFLPQQPAHWIDGPLFAMCCMTIRRAALGRMGGPPFDVSLHWYEDWDFEIRMINRCQVLILPQVLAHVRRFADGTRRHRPKPGEDPTVQQRYARLVTQRRVLAGAATMGGWSQEVIGRLNLKLWAIEEQLATLPRDRVEAP